MFKTYLNKEKYSIILVFLVAASFLQGSQQEQYKFSGFDLLFIPADAVIERMVEQLSPEFPFNFRNNRINLRLSQAPYPEIEYFYSNALRVFNRHIQIKFFLPDYIRINPIITILYKKQKSHSSPDDESFFPNNA
ncbi:MAG: hypothetical protein JXR46_05870 [Calditrichaceae bacterium]|nr:hypothetical protein [Calditrichaceae bacterium]MBN2708552.1 hypothetical protein [Calditrichaceae bacterium]RQV96863.1 MAG: hypothetical protein EH224_03135 [Calditrichota bacterium]